MDSRLAAARRPGMTRVVVRNALVEEIHEAVEA